MLINLSNHPSAQWDEAQKNAALTYGNIIDMPFPSIDPQASTDSVAAQAEKYEVKIRQLLTRNIEGTFAVHLMGELTFCFALVARLQRVGINCLVSTTRRQTIDYQDGKKISSFGFVLFRGYPNLSVSY